MKVNTYNDLRERIKAEGYRTKTQFYNYVKTLPDTIQEYIAGQLGAEKLDANKFKSWSSFVNSDSGTDRLNSGTWAAMLIAFSHLLYTEVEKAEENTQLTELEDIEKIEKRFEGLWNLVSTNGKQEIIKLLHAIQTKLEITLEYCEIQLEEREKNDNKERCLYTEYANCKGQIGVRVKKHRTDGVGVSLYVFENNIPVWVNNIEEGQTLYDAKLIDSWSGMTDLPKYWDAVNRHFKTYIVIPLVFKGLYSNFGFISFESYDYKRMPDDPKEEEYIKSLFNRIAEIVADNIITRKTKLTVKLVNQHLLNIHRSAKR
ncbi:hypothetical protein [Bacteroides sp. 519]|uniref:hypothetical protein n=1 Tax=Bacteroides sp. 519 TaxID=2302937 RepID=UPI0013D773C9|nr:hypothetical protein [Bacteroides sp. 519]NDV59259.1 hypothetical protein [Bacteroides sp. 519]